MLGAMGSTHCWTCTKMSSRTSFVGRGSQTGLSTLEVSYGKKRVPVKPTYAYLFSDAKGFPYPVDEPYKVDPTTGYPTPEVYTYIYIGV